MRPDRLPALRMLVLISLFAAAGLALTYRSLSYDWFWDDAHLVRPFSSEELRQALTGNWDIDDIENPGYRPMTVLFNHFRATLFGDSTRAHRLFMIALFAVYLALLGGIGIRLGMRFWQVLAAGIIILCAKNNWWDLVWITDGARVFGATLFAISGLLMVEYARSAKLLTLLLSLSFAALALLCREEMLATYPLLPLLFLAARALACTPCALKGQRASVRAHLLPAGTIAVALMVMAGGFLRVRQAWVPELNEVPRPFQEFGGAVHLIWTSYPMGWFPSEDTLLLRVIWTLMLGSMLLMAIRYLSPASRVRAGLWCLCVIIACSPGFIVWRPNLLLLPLSFFGYLIAEITGEVFTRSALWAAWCSAILVFAVLSSASRSLAAQESMSPRSSATLWADAQVVKNPLPVTAPEKRLERMRERLTEPGVPRSAAALDPAAGDAWALAFRAGMMSWPVPPKDLPTILWGDRPPPDKGPPDEARAIFRPRIGFLDP